MFFVIPTGSSEWTLSRLALKRNGVSERVSERGMMEEEEVGGGGGGVENIDLNACKHVWLRVIQLFS